VTYRVITGQYAKPVAEAIKKEGGPEVKAHLAWLIDSLGVHPGQLGTEFVHPEFGEARVAGVGDLIAAWTVPGHNIVILRMLRWERGDQ
jgi:hypothetical protein